MWLALSYVSMMGRMQDASEHLWLFVTIITIRSDLERQVAVMALSYEKTAVILFGLDGCGIDCGYGRGSL